MTNNPDEFIDQLSEEFAERCRAGEEPSIESYANQYPEVAEKIRKIFPSIAMMENFSRRHHSEVKLAQHTAAASRLPFESLGDFKIVREVGRGGMGIVLEAVQNSLDRNVAVKVLSKQAMLDEKHIRRFEREARTASKLHHTNIVPVFGVGHADGYHYIVMQLIDGVDLNSTIKAFRKHLENERRTANFDLLKFASQHSFRPDKSETHFSTNSYDNQETYTDLQAKSTHSAFDSPNVSVCNTPGKLADHQLDDRYFRSVAKIGIQTARALAYAHQKQILHRDIKPGNLLVDENQNVWIADFGLAKALEHDDVTRTNDVVGTLRYMAPEQVFSDADERSDIYSLGLTLYELLALQPVFDDTSLKALFRDKKQVKIIPPTKLIDNLPLDLETIVLKCCAYSPTERYQTANDVARDLQLYLDGLPIQARPWSTSEKLARWCRNNPVVAGLSATSVVLLMLVAAVAGIGYVNTDAAYKREQLERQTAIDQKQKAEETLAISIQALNRIYEKFVPETTTFETEYTDDEDNAVAVSSQPVVSDQTANILQELLSFYKQFSSKYRDNVDLKKSFAKANIRIGDIWKQLGEYQESQNAYNEAIKTVEYFAKTESSVEAVIESANLNNRLGDLHYLQGNVDRSILSYQKAKEILENHTNSSSSNSSLVFHLARTHYLIGRANLPKSMQMRRRGNMLRHGIPSFVNANQWLKKPKRPSNSSMDTAIKLLKNLKNESPPQNYLLALCYRDQPIDYENGLEQAERLLIELIESQQRRPEHKFALSETYSRFALRKNPEGKSEEYLRKAVGYTSELAVEHPSNPQYLFANSVNQFKLAVQISRGSMRGGFKPSMRQTSTNRSRESLEIVEQAIVAQEKLVNRFPDHREYNELKKKLEKFQERLLHRCNRDEHSPFFPRGKTEKEPIPRNPN